ncbi:NACHT, LRR and PYD domains-containing protein 12-like isoform X2 [Eucyclogobius newberryi]|uniref:NACHT, LRR and PYD domains-containing protein 12-like isoform X2 n=1 Tax=Eucyclogobius newberryi TaxID=166745 RepID=UPI003B5AD8DA
MKQKPLAEHLHNKCLQETCQSKLKCHLKQRFSHVSEGINMDGNRTLLNQIYTELYITEGGAAGFNEKHEVNYIEAASRKTSTSETIIKCEDIFKGPTHRRGKAEQTETQSHVKIKKKPLSIKGLLKKSPSALEKQGLNKDQQQIKAGLIKGRGPIRTVLMKGVAGIGKTVLTQKFSLDWAEGSANQDIQLLFPFTFRELNVLRNTPFSLVELMQHFFSEAKGLCSFQQFKVLFILDGLDECRLPLDFNGTRVLSDPTESTSVDVLLVNLIRGRLLPSALLWITTRPAAANQIPAEYISMVTEVRGFDDPQKEEYFRKRFKDEKEAIISHIKKSQSLYTMCHVPVFCWILSRVLRYVLKTTEGGWLPQTLTQMYVHFLVVQAKVKSRKYDGRSETDPPWTPKNREMVRSLGKLAFEQLQKGKLIFYEFDLSDSGINLTEASVYSGVFNQVFKEESGLYQDKVYCFLHLSVQEFLAALYVHQTFFSSGVNLLSTSLSSLSPGSESEAAFYHSAVDQALESPNGHLNMFLRFLLGLSLNTNQHLLTGLLTTTENSSQVNQKTIEYIKKRIDDDMSTDGSIDLFHCLNELNDHTLVEQIEQTISKGRLSNLSPAQWSALVFFLLSSDSAMEVFDLKKYSASTNAFLKLLPVIKASNKAILSSCFLSSSCCDHLSSAICSESSNLRHLDLSDNDIQDSGVEQLCSGLKSAPCRLEDLILRSCSLSSSCSGPLTSVLCSESSSLTHLDISANDLKDSGVEQLSCGLKSTHCRLKTLSLSACKLSQSCCASLASVLKSSCLTHLDLSYNNLKDPGVELLCLGLKSAPCRLETLGLSGCLVSEKGGATLASALNSAHTPLKELDLNYNHIGPSTKLLTRLRLDARFQLDKLW